MGNSWESVRLGDLIEIRGGFSYKGTFIGKGDSKLVGMGCVSFSERFLDNGCRDYGGDFPETHRLKPGDIVIATRQQSDNLPILGFPAIIPEYLEGSDVIVATNLYKLTNHSDIPNRFLYWLLRGTEYRNRILSCSKGTTVRMITKDAIEDFYFRRPPDDEIRKITDILDSLDDKIELNRRMNATLEGMAQALFKSWFVDFDPVIDNALAAGNPIPDELADRAEVRRKTWENEAPASFNGNEDGAGAPSLPAYNAHFPDSFQETEAMGWIPEGWKAGKITDLADLNSESWSNNTHPNHVNYVDLANTKNGRINEVFPYDYSEAPSRARRVLRGHDTIIGTVRPGNRSFAYIHEEGLTGSTGFAVLRPKQEACRSFVYLCLTQDDVIDHFAHLADGGAYPAVRPEVVGNLETVILPDELMELFDQKAYPLIEKIGQHQRATETLTKLRDTLLPKLISGELRVSDAQQLTEEALT